MPLTYLIFLLLMNLLYDIIFGHVSLTFPEARYPPLDFLDTARTLAPCGVPKPTNVKLTTLLTEHSYNFTWRTQYFHKGGFKLTLLDASGKVVSRLAPDSNSTAEYAGTSDRSTQSAQISLKEPCTGCTIVLERQALEWGKTYKFRSCADVNIVNPNNLKEDDRRRCSENGVLREDNTCQCNRFFTGDVCQYKNDCDSDHDCQNDGKCFKDDFTLTQRTCFCAFGYYGKNCEFKFKNKNFDDSCFNFDHFDEEASKESYPNYGLFNEKCYKKFDLNGQDFVYSRIVKDEVEIIMDYKTESYVSLGWRPERIDPTCRLFPDLEHSFRYKRDHIPAPDFPKNNGFVESALKAPLHPMDCTDIIVGSVKEEKYSRIQDMYTRDRSTPLNDEWFDGEMSLSAAYGIEKNGRTIVMFRRNVREIEPTDHPLGPGQIFGIYAKGQDPDVGGQLYKNDQLKYHGSANRGVFVFEFVPPNEMPTSGPLIFIKNMSEIKNEPRKTTSPMIIADLEQEEEPENFKVFETTIKPIPEPEPKLEPRTEPKPEPESTSRKTTTSSKAAFSPPPLRTDGGSKGVSTKKSNAQKDNGISNNYATSLFILFVSFMFLFI